MCGSQVRAWLWLSRTIGWRLDPYLLRSRAGADHLLDLVGALADREDLRVAVEAAHRVLLDEAVAAVDLHGLLRAAHREPPRLELRLRGGEGEVPLRVLLARGLVDEQPRGL